MLNQEEKDYKIYSCPGKFLRSRAAHIIFSHSSAGLRGKEVRKSRKHSGNQIFTLTLTHSSNLMGKDQEFQRYPNLYPSGVSLWLQHCGHLVVA